MPKTKSSTDKTKFSFTKNWALMKSAMFDQNRGLTPLEICKFFDHSKTTVLSSKKYPFGTRLSNDKTKVSITET